MPAYHNVDEQLEVGDKSINFICDLFLFHWLAKGSNVLPHTAVTIK
jgi:hypothetical protein